MRACLNCEELMPGGCTCPSCGSHQPCSLGARLPAAALVLGLTACSLTPGNGPTDDTWSGQADYGVAETGWVDEDGDGYSIRDGDCNDSDATIHPAAEETAGDGIDSNCNGEDDT